ncbi:protein MTSS 2 [Apus apus]|uniref:protein MTSS 2 n=1 Tax=Apus apus TaxID=8895 RepID=UPI0021F8EB79|nr:protein MTSS 2 [Apus apus]
MVAPGQCWDGITRKALGLILLEWPHQDGIRMALGWPPQHLSPVPVPPEAPHSGLGGSPDHPGALRGLRESSYPIWEDFNSKATKLHSQLRTTVLAAVAFLDAFQKVADMATNTREPSGAFP